MDFKLILEGIAVLGAMGAIFGALLAFAAKIFYVEVDPKQEAVRACLAGANCGGCGYPGCDGYAADGSELCFNRGKTYLAIVDDDEWPNFNYQ